MGFPDLSGSTGGTPGPFWQVLLTSGIPEGSAAASFAGLCQAAPGSKAQAVARVPAGFDSDSAGSRAPSPAPMTASGPPGMAGAPHLEQSVANPPFAPNGQELLPVLPGKDIPGMRKPVAKAMQATWRRPQPRA